MFKKELVNVIKQTLIFLAILAALPAAILVSRIVPKQPYQALFTPAVQAGLLFWSFFLGASLFGRERGQRALEYTASLPYSRLGLLARLAAPRILVAAFIGSLTLLIPAGWWQSYGVLPPALFGLSSLLLFTIALSFAPLFENFLVLAFSTLLAFFLVGLIPFATVFLAYRSRGFPLEKSFLPAWGEILSLGNATASSSACSPSCRFSRSPLSQPSLRRSPNSTFARRLPSVAALLSFSRRRSSFRG